MAVAGDTRWTGRAGALLLVAHLVAGVILPLLHAGDGFDSMPDHVEATGSHQPEHGTACLLCRAADSRVPAAVRDTGLRSGSAAGVVAASVADDPLPRRELATSTHARAPPSISPAA